MLRYYSALSSFSNDLNNFTWKLIAIKLDKIDSFSQLNENQNNNNSETHTLDAMNARVLQTDPSNWLSWIYRTSMTHFHTLQIQTVVCERPSYTEFRLLSVCIAGPYTHTLTRPPVNSNSPQQSNSSAATLVRHTYVRFRIWTDLDHSIRIATRMYYGFLCSFFNDFRKRKPHWIIKWKPWSAFISWFFWMNVEKITEIHFCFILLFGPTVTSDVTCLH